jgi:nitrogen regulatory protein PII
VEGSELLKQPRKLITIVTEAALESELCGALERLGATGYTVTDARGSGSRGVRDAGWSSSGNIRVEIVCGDEVADRIVEHLRRSYYDDYAMILYESDVRVLRRDKFV